MEQELCKLPINKENYGIVHFDFEADDVFYDEGTDTFSVIDFDDAMRCWFSLDVVRALDSLDDVTDEIMPDEASLAFLAGYKEECNLSDEQISSFALMRRLVSLQEYSTILYSISEPVDEQPNWLIELKDKLRQKMKRIENVIAK